MCGKGLITLTDILVCDISMDSTKISKIWNLLRGAQLLHTPV